MFISLKVFGQEPPINAIQKLGPNPYYVLDSTRIQQTDLGNIDPNQITSLTILTDTSAIKLFGIEANDGAVIIETKDFARKKFTKFFRQVSSQYDSIYTLMGDDNTFQYIINDNEKSDNYEGDLSLIDEEMLIDIKIIISDQLFSIYGISDKKYGIIIKSKAPPDLYNSKEKF
jgi:hypothetical protein